MCVLSQPVSSMHAGKQGEKGLMRAARAQVVCRARSFSSKPLFSDSAHPCAPAVQMQVTVRVKFQSLLFPSLRSLSLTHTPTTLSTPHLDQCQE